MTTNPNDPMPTDIQLHNIIIAVVIIICFSIFGPTMVVPLVEERSGKFKHQVGIESYWISQV
jgi:hypothetical protein